MRHLSASNKQVLDFGSKIPRFQGAEYTNRDQNENIGPGYYINPNKESLDAIKSKRLNVKTFKTGFGTNIKKGESLEERYAYIKDSQCSGMKTPGRYNPSVRLKISHNKSEKSIYTKGEKRFNIDLKN